MRYLTENLAALILQAGTTDPLDLLGENTDDAGNTFVIRALDEEATWDNPIPIDTEVQRWMTDGAVAATQGHENRVPYFKVIVSADTSAELAAGEAALAKRANQVSTLTWTPPEGDPDAPSSVFEIWTWHLEHIFDGAREGRLARMYGVRLKAKPWVRSVDLVTSTAVPSAGTPTVTLIDNCNALTNWVGSPAAATLSGTGAIHETTPYLKSNGVLVKLTRTASVTGLGTLPYLMINMAVTGSASPEPEVKIDGILLSKSAQVGPVSYWKVPTGTTSFTKLEISAGVRASGSGGTGSVTLSVADVSKTDVPAGVGSHKQLARSLPVGGSVKTSGSFHVSAPSNTPLGTTLLYTCPDDGSGYTPPMRQFRTSGNTVTPDSSCASGNHEALVASGASAGTIIYTVPAGLLPEATYAIVGRFILGAAALLTVTVQAKINGIIGQTTVGTCGTLGAVPVWGILGFITLPPLAIPAESQLPTVVTISATANSGTHTIDELYLLDITHGDYSLILAGNTSHSDLWLDAPDANPVNNTPAIYIGTLDDRTDAFTPDSAGILSIGDHDLDPDGALVFTVTDAEDDAVVTAAFYHRWHTHAGD